MQAQDVNKGQSSRYSQKYEVRSIIKAPNGKSVEVVTVWIIRRGNTFRALSRRIREITHEV